MGAALPHPDGFPPPAFEFILEALHAVVQGLPERRHVSGQELLDGLCVLARERFDFLAPMLLASWGLSTPRDLGRAVFRMVELGILSRRPEDTPADFDLPFTLEERILSQLDHLSAIRQSLPAVHQ